MKLGSEAFRPFMVPIANVGRKAGPRMFLAGMVIFLRESLQKQVTKLRGAHKPENGRVWRTASGMEVLFRLRPRSGALVRDASASSTGSGPAGQEPLPSVPMMRAPAN